MSTERGNSNLLRTIADEARKLGLTDPWDVFVYTKYRNMQLPAQGSISIEGDITRMMGGEPGNPRYVEFRFIPNPNTNIPGTAVELHVRNSGEENFLFGTEKYNPRHEVKFRFSFEEEFGGLTLEQHAEKLKDTPEVGVPRYNGSLHVNWQIVLPVFDQSGKCVGEMVKRFNPNIVSDSVFKKALEFGARDPRTVLQKDNILIDNNPKRIQELAIALMNAYLRNMGEKTPKHLRVVE